VSAQAVDNWPEWFCPSETGPSGQCTGTVPISASLGYSLFFSIPAKAAQNSKHPRLGSLQKKKTIIKISPFYHLIHFTEWGYPARKGTLCNQGNLDKLCSLPNPDCVPSDLLFSMNKDSLMFPSKMMGSLEG
jgi:hypothetical protein